VKQKQCKCGGTEFTAHQRSYHDVIVDGSNTFLEDKGSYDSDNPYGPYRCKMCSTEYEELDGLVEVEADDIIFPDRAATPLLEQFKITKTPRKTVRISWDSLDSLFCRLLTALLGRDIRVEAGREEFYYWKATLLDSISLEELETLFALTQASKYDMEANDFGEYPITELSEGLCNKLMAMLLPFGLDSTKADDNGVWFIGDDAKQTIELALPNGMSFTAKIGGDIPYPGIYIYLKQPDGSEDNICYAEYNSSREEHRRICVSAYAHNIDEPTYYASYHDDGVPWE
jgi:hypothetical protein